MTVNEENAIYFLLLPYPTFLFLPSVGRSQRDDKGKDSSSVTNYTANIKRL